MSYPAWLTSHMTKTEANQAIALQVTVFARRTQQAITKTAVEEHLSECGAGHRGEYLAAAAAAANYKTVLKIAIADAKLMGDYHLIGA